MEARWKAHVRAALSPHRSGHFQRAIALYGPAAFAHEVLETTTDLGEANYAEDWWIEHFQARDPRFGFNVLRGGRVLPHPVKNPWLRPDYRAKLLDHLRSPGRRDLARRVIGGWNRGSIRSPRRLAKLRRQQQEQADRLRWQSLQTEILRRHANGESQRDLAKALGIPRVRIMRLVATHKMAAPDYHPMKKPGAGFGTRAPQTEEILRRVLSGEHRPSLAREYGINRSRITAIVRSARRSGIEVPRGRST